MIENPADRFAEKMAALGAYALDDAVRVPTDDEVADVEADLGAALPDAYRGFVRRYGLTYLKHNAAIRYRVSWLMMAVGYPNVFLGIRKGYFFDLRAVRAERPVPERADLLPIAIDGVGGRFCLSLEGPSRGSVYFYGRWGLPGSWGLYRLADTFVEFIDAIYIEPEDDEDQERDPIDDR